MILKTQQPPCLIKGMMSGAEFLALHYLIRTWEPRVRTNLLARLRAGGRLIRSKA